MPDCKFAVDGDKVTCQVCKRSLPGTNYKTRRKCVGEQHMPGAIAMAMSLAKAAVGFVFDKLKHCTPEEVAARFKNCRYCNWYTGTGADDADGRCIGCGCYVNGISDGSAVNKLMLLSEQCPWKKGGKSDGPRQPKWTAISHDRAKTSARSSTGNITTTAGCSTCGGAK